MTILKDSPVMLGILLHRMTELRRQQGLPGMVRHCAAYLWRLPQWLNLIRREIAYDREMGVQTSRLVAASDLGVDPSKLTDVSTSSRGAAHMPSPRWALMEMLSQLDIRYPDYTFIDLGSGMGRVVLMASELPFRKVIGVEFSPDLHNSAQANVAARRAAVRSGALELLCQDAREYEFPSENCVIYMFNPFREGVMRAVLKNIEQLCHNSRHELYIAYFNPVCGPLLDASPFLTKVKSTRHYSIYHTFRNEFLSTEETVHVPSRQKDHVC
jgi:predicted RNA methylase